MSAVVHVGLPKTASTHLQRYLWPQFDSFAYFTSDQSQWPAELGWLYTVNRHFDRYPPENRNEQWDELSDVDERLWVPRGRSFADRTGPLLLSSEGLCGVSYSPTINSRLIALLLGQILGTYRIVFVFRRQDRWAASIHRQLVWVERRFGRPVTFAEMFGDYDNPRTLTSIATLDWSRMVSDYSDIVGPENVLAIPYELLSSDPSEFVGRIASFVSPGAHINALPVATGRSNVSRGFNSRYARFGMIISRYKPPTSAQLYAILSQLSERNRELANMTGYDLARFGYVL